MKLSWFVPAIIWLIISTILLTLPGSDIPSSSLFDLLHIDKAVHLTMFALLTYLFTRPQVKAQRPRSTLLLWAVIIAVLVIGYGISMEYVQEYYSEGRSFDLFDMIFDALGSIIGAWAILRFARKQIGPDRNQGRNQN